MPVRPPAQSSSSGAQRQVRHGEIALTDLEHIFVDVKIGCHDVKRWQKNLSANRGGGALPRVSFGELIWVGPAWQDSLNSHGVVVVVVVEAVSMQPLSSWPPTVHFSESYNDGQFESPIVSEMTVAALKRARKHFGMNRSILLALMAERLSLDPLTFTSDRARSSCSIRDETARTISFRAVPHHPQRTEI